MATLESPTAGTYLMTMQWSILRPVLSLKRISLEAMTSSTTDDLLISLERNWLGADKFLPSLLPEMSHNVLENRRYQDGCS